MIFRIAALGVGALAMYYFDPISGTRRRAALRDKLVHARHEARNYADDAYRDLSNRARGVVADARSASERRRAQREDADRRDPMRPVDIDLS